MSEKRFVQCEIEYGFANTTNIKKVDGIYDMQEEKTYRIEQIVDLLNEQQATIIKLKEELELTANTKLYSRRELERKVDEQQATIEELRLQEKEKGVPVFVVRDGKNPIALFFNEQRASLYCQENMANLTYQQEKWCRVE